VRAAAAPAAVNSASPMVVEPSVPRAAAAVAVVNSASPTAVEPNSALRMLLAVPEL